MTPQQLAKKILKKEKLALAQFITLLENRNPQAIAETKKLRAASADKAIRIGVTGPQGVGKSSLLSRLIEQALKKKKRIGVLVVDPTSPLHGGAFLGDRLRMQQHTLNNNVFIRSMATRTNQNGLSPAIDEAATALEAFGCDLILIETIGIGQDEIAVTQIVDRTALILSPDFGDKFQAMKSGLIEVCDLIVVNKIDLPKAKSALIVLQEMSKLPVFGVSAKSGTGVDKLLETLLKKGFSPRGAHQGRFFSEELSLSIDHIGIAVKKIKTALPFYQEQLGLKKVFIETVPQQKVRVAILPIGNSQIELLEATSKNSPIAKFIAKRGEGIHHIAFETTDLKKRLKNLSDQGVCLIDSTPRRGAQGKQIAFLHPKSTFGSLVELTQR